VKLSTVLCARSIKPLGPRNGIGASREKLVTNSSPKLADFGVFSGVQNSEKQSRQGFWVNDLIFDIADEQNLSRLNTMP